MIRLLLESGWLLKLSSSSSVEPLAGQEQLLDQSDGYSPDVHSNGIPHYTGFLCSVSQVFKFLLSHLPTYTWLRPLQGK